MTPEEIRLVQESFKKVVPIKDTASEIFYKRLFEVDPTVRSYFKGDMVEQRNKLMAALAAIVNGLGNIDMVIPVAQQLARRHVVYGVQRHHYSIVGETLLWTLKQGLGDAFDEETAAAWAKAYTTLSSVMIDAASQVGFKGQNESQAS